MFIRTVMGDVPLEAIEKTMIHEHIVLDLSGVRNGDIDSILEDSTEMDEEMSRVKNNGCNTIVEVTNIGMGRNPHSLKDIANKNDLHIIAATGFYKEAVYPPFVFQRSAEDLTKLMTKELCTGMDGTDIRAGIISEIGSSLNEITDTEKKVFFAAYQAQQETGAPLSTHCELGTMGKAQLDLFEKWGADFQRISLGHQDLNTNVEEQLYILSTGAYIQFDTIGKSNYRSDDDRMKNLLYLLDKGFEDQIMLSCDITRKSYMKYRQGHGYDHLFTVFVPQLERHGANKAVIDQLLIHNPKNFLSYKGE